MKLAASLRSLSARLHALDASECRSQPVKQRDEAG